MTNITQQQYEGLLNAVDTLTTQVRTLSKKVKSLDEQRYFWTKEWQRGEAEATHDIKNSNLYVLRDADDLDKPLSKLQKHT